MEIVRDGASEQEDGHFRNEDKKILDKLRKKQERIKEVNENTIIDIIAKALRNFDDNRVNDISVDSDNDSSEIIITVDNGEDFSDWIIRSRDIKNID